MRTAPCVTSERQWDDPAVTVREEDFTLDPTGNWSGYLQKISGSTQLNQSRTHNKVNEVTDITETVGPAWATLAHDGAGNMTTVPDPLGLTAGLTLKYDAWNRLVEVKEGAEVVAQYEYDGLNRRVLKRVPVTGESSASGGGPEYETDYYFHNAGWQVLETRRTDQSSASPDNLQPRYQYVWSARYIDSPILRDKNTDTDWLCDDQRLYYLTDANFNVTTLVDTNGDAVERYLYDPYGKLTIYDGTWTNTRSSSSYDNTILYTGREYDAETGVYHYRRRPYTVDLARFLSRDPISDVNLYRYVGNNPTGMRDPWGLDSSCDASTVGTVVAYRYTKPPALMPGTNSPGSMNLGLGLVSIVGGIVSVVDPTSHLSGAEAAVRFAKIDWTMWADLAGRQASVWTYVVCYQCRCRSFASAWLYGWYGWDPYWEGWVQCDVSETTWGKRNADWAFGMTFFHSVPSAEDLITIGRDCQAQVSDSDCFAIKTGLLQTRSVVVWRAHGQRLFRVPGLVGRPR